MSMRISGFNITVVLKYGILLDAYFELGEEVSVGLSPDSDLFKDAKTLLDIRRGVEAGFIPQGQALSFSELIAQAGDSDYFEAFWGELQKEAMEDISAILLIADTAAGEQRSYAWRKTTFQPYGETGGVQPASYDPWKRKYVPELTEFLKGELIAPSDYIRTPQTLLVPEEFRSKEVLSRDCKIDFLDVLTGYTGQETLILLPEGITAIGRDAFLYHQTLRSIVIPEGVEEIEPDAFWGCEKLEYVELPDTLKRIGSSAFRNCASLKSILIPGAVESIGNDAFSGCHGLTDIFVPISVWDIGYDAFSTFCPETVIHTPRGSNAEEFARANHIRTDCRKPLRRKAPALQTGVQSGVQSIVIPEGITEISSYDFGDSTAVRLVLPVSLKKIGAWAFDKSDVLCEIVINEDCQEIGAYAFQECSHLQEVILPAGIQTLGSSVFSGCGKLKTAHVQAPVSRLPDYMFFKCRQLADIQLPESLRHMGNAAFCQCSCLASVDLPRNLRSIGDNAFYFCEKLTSIRIPAATETIGKEAFFCCEKLKDIHIPGLVRQIGEDAFRGIAKDARFHVAQGSYAEEYCREQGLGYDYDLHPELIRLVEALEKENEERQKAEEEQLRRQAEDARRREAEERERRRKEEEAQKRKEAQEREQQRRQAEEAQRQLAEEIERRHREAEEAERIAEEERQRQRREAREEERKASDEHTRRQQAALALERERYDSLADAIGWQTKTIEKYTGWFGLQAKARREAKQMLTMLQARMEREFPNGRP